MAQAVVESILPLFNTSSGFFGQYDCGYIARKLRAVLILSQSVAVHRLQNSWRLYLCLTTRPIRMFIVTLSLTTLAR